MGIVQNATIFMYLQLLCYVLVKEAGGKEKSESWMMLFSPVNFSLVT